MGDKAARVSLDLDPDGETTREGLGSEQQAT